MQKLLYAFHTLTVASLDPEITARENQVLDVRKITGSKIVTYSIGH